MRKNIHHAVFAEPISRRTFYWILFLCPVVALWIYLASRRVTIDPVADVATSLS